MRNTIHISDLAKQILRPARIATFSTLLASIAAFAACATDETPSSSEQQTDIPPAISSASTPTPQKDALALPEEPVAYTPTPTSRTPDPDTPTPEPTPAPSMPERDLEIITLLAPDAIPAISNPQFFETIAEADQAYYDTELVLGIEINDDARAYSVPLLSRHEIVNDIVGGEPVAVTW